MGLFSAFALVVNCRAIVALREITCVFPFVYKLGIGSIIQPSIEHLLFLRSHAPNHSDRTVILMGIVADFMKYGACSIRLARMVVSGTNRHEQPLSDRNDRRLKLGSTTNMMKVFNDAFEHRPSI